MADQKLTDLTERTTPTSADVVYVVEDPTGTPLSKHATLNNVGSNAFIGVVGNWLRLNVTENTNMLALDGSRFLHLGNVGSGNNNLFMGELSGPGTETGDRNLAIGESSLSALTTGNGNIALGYQAGQDISIGSNNCLVGDKAGANITTSNNNFCLGFNAGAALTTVGNNTFIGTSVGSLATNGQNVAIGSECTAALTTGEEHCVIGARALAAMQTGNSCTAIGRDALRNLNTTGQVRTTAVGFQTLNGAVTSAQTTAVGSRAGLLFTQNEGVFLGYNAGQIATSARRLVAIGYNANPVSATNNYQLVISNCIFGTGMDASGTPSGDNTNIAGLIGICQHTPLAKLHVKQNETADAIPVLELEQLDIDDTFINFVGTSAADGTRSISSDTTEDSAKFGAVRVEINGTTKWIRIYDDES